jgi:hypothetical protein
MVVKRVGQLCVACILVFLLVWSCYRFSVDTITAAHLQFTRAGSSLDAAARYAQVPGYEWVRSDLLERYRDYGEYAGVRGASGIDFVDWAKAAGFPSPLAGRHGHDTMAGAPPSPPLSLRDRMLEPIRRRWHWISVHVPLPAPFFIAGLQLVAQHSRGGHPAFLLGQYSSHGWWYYFPVVWFFKTPLPFVILSIAGIALLAVRGWKTRDGEALAVAIAPLAMFIPAMVAGINIGVRHILPIYPLMAIASAFAVQSLWSGRPGRRIAVVLLLAWQLVSTTMAHPDYLAWFNEAAGKHPEEIAVDSNLDWGQDLLRLVDEIRRSRIDRLYLSYFGSADPKRHPIPAQPLAAKTPECGWVAVSEMNLKFGGLMARKENRGENLRWLRAYEPVRRVGKSIRLYDIPCK